MYSETILVVKAVICNEVTSLVFTHGSNACGNDAARHCLHSSRFALWRESKKSRYAIANPSLKLIVGRHPRELSREISRSLRGVPSGLLGSNLSSPS